MNFGRDSVDKEIRTADSRRTKYLSKTVLTVVKICLVICLFVAVFGTTVAIGAVKSIIDSAPEIDMASIVPSGYATTVYDAAGNVTETLVTSGSNREDASWDEIPEDLINAFVAIEDARFWTHNGIDLRSILRAAVGLFTGDNAGGGSTITQQLIKNNIFNGGMETTMGEKLERKLQEQYLAVELTRSMDRQQILLNYLNTINLGNNTLGVKVAARRYFNKELSDLTLSECAVIAGITQNPSRLNPISGAEANAERREIILENMYEQGYITKTQQLEALADNVYDRIQDVDTALKETSTPYSYFTDELISQVSKCMTEELGYTDTQAQNLIYSGGLKIYTTQDPRIQAIVDEEVNNPDNYSAARYSLEYRLSVNNAEGETSNYSERNISSWHENVLHDSFDGLYNSEEAVTADIEAYKAWLLTDQYTVIGENSTISLEPQVSFVIMDQRTGEVKAISGGRGEKTASLTLNRATDTKRQPGSAFKVITSFAPAIDACGQTLSSVYYDGPYTVGNKTFNNWYSTGYLGYSTIRDGIVYSMNIVAVRCLMETVTPELGIEYAKKFGITTLTDTDCNAALALGGITDGVTNLELTGAYAAIANGGVYNEPIFFTKIYDHDGKLLIDKTPESHRVLRESTAFLLTDAMKDSLISSHKWASSGYNVGSTSTRCKLDYMSCAGKSGTTSNNNDVWFVGFTPYYTAGVWGGCDNNQKLTAQNGGTSFHKDIWKSIMTRVHEGLEDPGFAVPDNVTTAEVCRKSGKLGVSGLCTADPRGNAIYTEYFDVTTVPMDTCDKHVICSVCDVTGLLPAPACTTTSRVCIAVPSDVEGSTDDTAYAVPTRVCSGHSGEELRPEADENEAVEQIGPGQTSSTGQVSSQAPSSGSSGNVSSSAPSSAPTSNSGSSVSKPTAAAGNSPGG